MQIISEIPTNHYLVKLTREEMVNLLGYESIYDEGVKSKIKNCIAEGTDIKISEFFKNTLLFDRIKKRGIYDKASNKLKEMLIALQPIELLFQNTDLTKLSKDE